MNALCGFYRSQLERRPALAARWWSRWLRQGINAAGAEGTSSLWAAFELACHCAAAPDALREPGPINWYDRLMIAGHVLSQRCADQQREILLGVHERLWRAATLRQLPRAQRRGLLCNLQISLLMLRRHYRACGEQAVPVLLCAALQEMRREFCTD